MIKLSYSHICVLLLPLLLTTIAITTAINFILANNVAGVIGNGVININNGVYQPLDHSQQQQLLLLEQQQQQLQHEQLHNNYHHHNGGSSNYMGIGAGHNNGGNINIIGGDINNMNHATAGTLEKLCV